MCECQQKSNNRTKIVLTNVRLALIMVTEAQKMVLIEINLTKGGLNMSNMETILRKEEKEKVDLTKQMLQSMNDGERDKMLIFMQGVNFAKSLAEKPEVAAN